MKSLLFLVISMLLSTLSFGQSLGNEPDARLYEVFEASFLTKLQKKSPVQIERYNFLLDNIYFITDMPDKKDVSLDKVIIEDLNNINILAIMREQNLKRTRVENTYYRIANTNKVLVLLCEDLFTEKLNKHLGRSH